LAFLGGINVSEEYADTELRAGWADLAVEIEGDAASWLRGELRGEKKAPLKDPGLRLWLAHEAGAGKLRKRYVKAIGAARKSIYLAHAYFLPDRRLIRSLRAATRRGVQVTLLLAGKTDVFFARAATMRLHRQLLQAGVRIFEWSRSVLHAKAAVIDGQRLLVGSFNLDPLSLANLEALVEIENDVVAGQGESWITRRIALSDEVDLADRSRSLLQRWLWDVVGLWAARATGWLASLLAFRRRTRKLRESVG
ncbi:MAG TPA: phospholipase D-like domain-containing protein, partial [Myxococcaceae bacterium]|nr:phospholipase D-like domain-containing protein [Myxococcaceae bacterium]